MADHQIHPATASLLRFFNFGHLPLYLQDVSEPFHDLAHRLATEPETRDGGAELTTALRKLLEAKDCAVRAAVPTTAPEPEHDTSGDGTSCWCNPTVEDVEAADGSHAGRLVVHNSADGREHREPDHDREACETCKASAS